MEPISAVENVLLLLLDYVEDRERWPSVESLRDKLDEVIRPAFTIRELPTAQTNAHYEAQQDAMHEADIALAAWVDQQVLEHAPDQIRDAWTVAPYQMHRHNINNAGDIVSERLRKPTSFHTGQPLGQAELMRVEVYILLHAAGLHDQGTFDEDAMRERQLVWRGILRDWNALPKVPDPLVPIVGYSAAAAAGRSA